jgi:hypothetical protein
MGEITDLYRLRDLMAFEVGFLFLAGLSLILAF